MYWTGKVGGFIASIPEVMVAGLLCFMWAMLAALGLSNLRYSEAGSSRNIIIIGLSLFFSLSIPAYFQQYGISPNSNLSVPSYFQPYIVASHGPFHSKYGGVYLLLLWILCWILMASFGVIEICSLLYDFTEILKNEKEEKADLRLLVWEWLWKAVHGIYISIIS